jgi:hypothetical protein
MRRSTAKFSAPFPLADSRGIFSKKRVQSPMDLFLNLATPTHCMQEQPGITTHAGDEVAAGHHIHHRSDAQTGLWPWIAHFATFPDQQSSPNSQGQNCSSRGWFSVNGWVRSAAFGSVRLDRLQLAVDSIQIHDAARNLRCSWQFRQRCDLDGFIIHSLPYAPKRTSQHSVQRGFQPA